MSARARGAEAALIFSFLLLSCAGTQRAAAAESVQLLRASATEVVVRVEAPGPQFHLDPTTGLVEVQVSGWSRLLESGAPELPSQGFLLGIPPGTQPVLVGVRVISRAQFPGRRPRPAPEREILEGSDGLPFQRETRRANADRYSGVYPENWARLGAVGGLRHLQVVPVEVTPFRWDPALGGIEVATVLEVEIHFQPAETKSVDRGRPRSTTPAADLPSWERLYGQTVLNWEEARNYRRSPLLWSQVRAARELGAPPEFRITVDKSEVYRISYQDLVSAGWDQGEVPVDQLALVERFFVESDSANPFHEEPVPILVRDLDVPPNGSFDSGDDFIFLGLTAWDRLHPAPREKRYGRLNAYFLTVRAEGGGRMAEGSSFLNREDLVPETTFRWRDHLEGDGVYMKPVAIGDNGGAIENGILSVNHEHFYWFGGGISDVPERHQKTFDLPGLVRPLGLRMAFQGITNPPGGISGRPVLSAAAPPPAAFVVLPGQIVVPPKQRVVHSWSEGELSGLSLVASQNRFRMELPPDGYGCAVDWMEWTYERSFNSFRDVVKWSTNELTGAREFRARGFSGTDLLLFDVSDSLAPRVLPYGPNQLLSGPNGLRVQLDLGTGATRRVLVALRPGGAIAPKEIARVSEDDLTELGTEDLIVITHGSFLSELEPLIERRRTTMGVRVANVRDVFDQFNGGRPWPTALRNYLRFLFRSRDLDPSFLLLVGDASDDFQNVIANESAPNFVPTMTVFSNAYSTQQQEMVSSDEWFVDNLTGTGERLDFLPDMHVGRLPVGSTSELSVVVSKLLAYENFRETDTWRNRALLVSDDEYSSQINFADAYSWRGDPNRNRPRDLNDPFDPGGPRNGESVFRYAARATRWIIHTLGGFTDFGVDTCFVASYMDTVACLERCHPDSNGSGNCADWTCPYENNDLVGGYRSQVTYSVNLAYGESVVSPLVLQAMSRGYLFVTFQGHANWALFTHEYVFRDAPFTGREDSRLVNNLEKPFIFMGYGCHLTEFSPTIEATSGRGDCVGEKLLFQADGRGSIASIASTAYEWLDLNEELNLAMMRSWFLEPPQDASGHTRWLLGEMFTGGKYVMRQTGDTREIWGQVASYVLLGDPTLPVDIAPPRVARIEVNGDPWELGQRLVSEASTDTARIQLWIRDEVWISELSVWDADGQVDPSEYQLLPDPDAPGDDRRRLLVYPALLAPPAQDYDIEVRGKDRVGREQNVRLPVQLGARFFVSVQGNYREINPKDPNQFLGPGDSIKVEVESPVQLQDSEVELWMDEIPLVDPEAPLVGEAEGSSRRNTAWTFTVHGRLPPELSEGEHALRLRVRRRTDGGMSERSLSFQGVSSSVQLLQTYNFPNPFEERTSFYYVLNGNAASARVSIFTVRGRKIQEIQGTSFRGTNEIPWDGLDQDGDRVANGVYFYKLEIKTFEGKSFTRRERLARIR